MIGTAGGSGSHAEWIKKKKGRAIRGMSIVHVLFRAILVLELHLNGRPNSHSRHVEPEQLVSYLPRKPA